MGKHKRVIYIIVGALSMIMISLVVYSQLLNKDDQAQTTDVSQNPAITQSGNGDEFSITGHKGESVSTILAKDISDSQKAAELFVNARRQVSVDEYNLAREYFDAALGLTDTEDNLKNAILYDRYNLAVLEANEQDKSKYINLLTPEQQTQLKSNVVSGETAE